MPLITLTTDFGSKDPSVGAVKGALYSQRNEVEIVDITHAISPFNLTEAAYVIRNAYKKFPDGTIHIIGVDSEATPENKHVLVLLDGHFFIGADNGILSLIASKIKPDKIIELSNVKSPDSSFPVLEIFTYAAVHLFKGQEPEKLGPAIDKLKYFKEAEPFYSSTKEYIVGAVLYIDNYGNVITNITSTYFEAIRKGREYCISARAAKFYKIYRSYSDGIDFGTEKPKREEDGKKLAIFNSNGYLELAIYKSNHDTVGSAAALFGLKVKDSVTINFF